jgi:ribulose-phosphate 3-epimerase
MVKIAPSLMCADALHLQKDIEALDRAGVDLFHMDVMDGHFAPNLAMNLETVRQIRAVTQTPIDVHLMVDRPDFYFPALGQAQVEYASFHIETSTQPLRLIQNLKAQGAKAGIALNPCTPLENLLFVLDQIDFVLVMTVEPGFTGQVLIPATLEKISTLSELIKKRNLNVDIEVDGNISVETGKACLARGATIFVAGTSSIFTGTHDLDAACREFRRQISQDCLHTSATQTAPTTTGPLA